MNTISRVTALCAAALLCVQTAAAQSADCTDKAVCGEVSPLIPMQSTEAVHMGLVWKKGSQSPKILFHSRFPEYTPNDVADPAVIDATAPADAVDQHHLHLAQVFEDEAVRHE